MLLDTVSVLIALGGLCCSFGMAMLLVWHRFSPGRPMLLWAIGMVSCGMGSFLVSLRYFTSPVLSLFVGNLLVVGSFCLVWWGCSLHRGHSPPRRMFALSLFLFSALYCWFAFAEPDMAWRVLITRAFMALYLAGALAALMRGERRKGGMERVALATLALNLLFQLVTGGMQLVCMSCDEPLRNNANVALTALLSLVGVACWGLAVILMKLEKMVEELKSAENHAQDSRKLMETIIDHIPALVYLKDPQGRVLACNRNLADLLGVAPQDVLGRTSHDFFPAPLAEKQRADDLSVLESGRTLVTDESLELEDGRHLFETTKLAVRDGEGRITSLCGITHDVTDRRRAEEALRDSRALFDMIANSSPAMLWMSGPDGKCTWFNETWLSFTGRSLEQELGDGWAERVHPDDVGRCLGTYREAFEARRPFSMEYRLLHQGGDYRWLLDQGQPRHDVSGAFCGYIGSCLDVHDRHQADEMLRRKNDEIEQFIYTVSHDLRSPLVTIKSFLGYLEQDMHTADGARIDQDLHFIHTAADRMELLLTELLELSRVGRLENPPQETNFRELVSDSLSLVAGQIVEQKVRVRVDDEDQPLRGDRPRLVQIWQNLLDNAAKYMGDQPSPLIELGILRRNGEVVFFVRDNGIGIDPEGRERIFGLFDKLDRKSSGVGLGLAMVRRIVENYGGRIWVESPGRGGGSCFNFTLPGALLVEGGA